VYGCWAEREREREREREMEGGERRRETRGRGVQPIIAGQKKEKKTVGRQSTLAKSEVSHSQSITSLRFVLSCPPRTAKKKKLRLSCLI
jgi:hypothetical protein